MTHSSPLHPDDLADLALGIEDPARRPVLLDHLSRCRSCREELASMADLSDRLAALAPAAEPPAGFEQRVLDRVADAPAGHPERHAGRPRGSSGRDPRRLRTTGWLAAAAAAVAAAIAVPVTLAAGSGGHSSPLHEAVLASAKGPVGDVIVDYGGSPWMSMWVQGWPGQSLTCQLMTGSGTAVTVGEFVPGPHNGFWATPIPASAGHPHMARLVDSAGQVVATARLP